MFYLYTINMYWWKLLVSDTNKQPHDLALQFSHNANVLTSEPSFCAETFQNEAFDKAWVHPT